MHGRKYKSTRIHIYIYIFIQYPEPSDPITHHDSIPVWKARANPTSDSMMSAKYPAVSPFRKLNVMVETSGRDIAMYHYVDHFFLP